MVVGHTPQLRGIDAAVTQRGYEVWQTDTCVSQGMMSSPLEALEVLVDGRVHVLTETGVVPAAMRSPEETDALDGCDVDTGISTPLPEDNHCTQPAEPRPVPGVRARAPEEAPVSGPSGQNKLEVEVLRQMDDKSSGIQERLSFLLERWIADAVRREDEALTKKVVKDVLSKVVGTEVTSENEEYVTVAWKRDDQCHGAMTETSSSGDLD